MITEKLRIYNPVSFMQDSKTPIQQNNVVKFRKIKKVSNDNKGNHPPLIKLPPVTKYLCLSIIATHLIIFGMTMFFGNAAADNIYNQLGFVPASWTGNAPFNLFTLFSPLAINFLHAGWFHLGVNVATLVAFGSGIEKRMGGKNMLILFFATSIAAVFTHLLFSMHSLQPVIGASGGISGLFGAVLMMMKHDARLTGVQQNILPTALIWIAITILFGVMGGPEGMSIAWIAHIGGFVAGLGLSALMLKKI